MAVDQEAWELSQYVLEVMKATAPAAFPPATNFISAMEMTGARLAGQWASMSASTAPIWRTITMNNPIWGRLAAVEGGSSWAATASGAGALGIAGLAIVVEIGVWMALGAGYYEARKKIQRAATTSGFSKGFVTGILGWQWQHVVTRFVSPRVIRKNVVDPDADFIEDAAHYEGLFMGFNLGRKGPEDKKKVFRKALRGLAGRRDNAAWSRDADTARNQQIDYVINLAGAGMRYGLIVPE